MRKKIIAVMASVLFIILTMTATSQAQASTLRCTSTESCGGATLADAVHGQLALSVLAPDNNTNDGFGYWNEPVGVNTAGLADGTQDFTVYQVSGEPVGGGGVYGHGNYVVVYTPGGKTPDDPAFTDKATGTETAYCVSVQDIYRTVRGHRVQRWVLVLRNCDVSGIWGSAVFSPGETSPEVPATVRNADPYQLWAPVEVSGPYLEFQDVALNSASFRHGFGGSNFVMDDTAFGGPNTQGIAFSENDGLNQKFTIDGCTEPVTVFNKAYYDCAS